MITSRVASTVERSSVLHHRVRVSGLTLLLVMLIAASVAPMSAQNTEDPLAGAKASYAQYCSRCHGTNGGGGEGPSLLRAELEHASTEEELTVVLRQGLPGTGMPGHWQLSDDDMAELVRYVRSLGQVAPEPLTGDPDRGARVYEDNGCEACHVLSGVGRGIGPELTRIGLQRGIAYLRESLVDPQAVISEDYLFLRARLRTGDTLEGLRINEDEFSLQIRDANGRFHSLDKSDVERIDRMRNRSIMRSYARSLEPQEIEDLVSFLATRRGRNDQAKVDAANAAMDANDANNADEDREVGQ